MDFLVVVVVVVSRRRRWLGASLKGVTNSRANSFLARRGGGGGGTRAPKIWPNNAECEQASKREWLSRLLACSPPKSSLSERARALALPERSLGDASLPGKNLLATRDAHPHPSARSLGSRSFWTGSQRRMTDRASASCPHNRCCASKIAQRASERERRERRPQASLFSARVARQ